MRECLAQERLHSPPSRRQLQFHPAAAATATGVRHPRPWRDDSSPTGCAGVRSTARWSRPQIRNTSPIAGRRSTCSWRGAFDEPGIDSTKCRLDARTPRERRPHIRWVEGGAFRNRANRGRIPAEARSARRAATVGIESWRAQAGTIMRLLQLDDETHLNDDLPFSFILKPFDLTGAVFEPGAPQLNGTGDFVKLAAELKKKMESDRNSLPEGSITQHGDNTGRQIRRSGAPMPIRSGTSGSCIISMVSRSFDLSKLTRLPTVVFTISMGSPPRTSTRRWRRCAACATGPLTGSKRSGMATRRRRRGCEPCRTSGWRWRAWKGSFPDYRRDWGISARRPVRRRQLDLAL